MVHTEVMPDRNNNKQKFHADSHVSRQASHSFEHFNVVSCVGRVNVDP